jgi:hypothetical protein
VIRTGILPRWRIDVEPLAPFLGGLREILLIRQNERRADCLLQTAACLGKDRTDIRQALCDLLPN